MFRGAHRRSLSLVATVALAWAAGCGGGGTKTGGRAGAPNQAHVITVRAAPERTIPLRRVRQAAINVPNLSWLTSFGGYVWVKRDDGFVVKIDPRSNKTIAKLGAFTDQEHYCQGIGAGGGAVWSCS